jgi:hypothetical protein
LGKVRIVSDYKQAGEKSLADVQKANDELWKDGEFNTEQREKAEKAGAVKSGDQKRVHLPRRASRKWRSGTFS